MFQHVSAIYISSYLSSKYQDHITQQQQQKNNTTVVFTNSCLYQSIDITQLIFLISSISLPIDVMDVNKNQIKIIQ